MPCMDVYPVPFCSSSSWSCCTRVSRSVSRASVPPLSGWLKYGGPLLHMNVSAPAVAAINPTRDTMEHSVRMATFGLWLVRWSLCISNFGFGNSLSTCKKCDLWLFRWLVGSSNKVLIDKEVFAFKMNDCLIYDVSGSAVDFCFA